ncbi:MFS transporter [Actinophytocola oryzae]|uniref:Putative MFS family arabinose efflux permease n=1 Tax=Actinophytocola oryzae TaxID=502181 RepID=A0A4R7VJX5_9PSEU|nr:MFS transporter [Actinophytocola oryzae]TDV49742.1 putative MFS family arabinose efflux permease [Actinophytocola oryzae]
MTDRVVPLRHNRDFLLLWSGSAVSILGSRASGMAYPLLVLALTGSIVDAGLVGFVTMLPVLLFQIPAGMLVDLWDRKRVMIWCDVLRALVITTIVVAVLADRLTLPHILLVGIVEATLSVAHGLAASAAVPNVVHSSQLTVALSRNEARERGAMMLGQPLGGILFGIGRAVPFLFDVVSYLVSLVTLLLIRKDFQTERTGERKRMRTELTEGVRWLLRQPFLRTTTILVAGSNLLFQALFLTVIVLAGNIGATPGAIGLMFGIASVGGVLGSLVAPAAERRLSMKVVVIGVNWVWALMVPVILLVRDPYLLGAVYALMCFVGPVWNVVISAYQLAITPDRIQGRVIGAASMVAFGAIPVGSLVGGLLLGSVGARTTVWILAVFMVFIATVATVNRAIRAAPSLGSLESKSTNTELSHTKENV